MRKLNQKTVACFVLRLNINQARLEFGVRLGSKDQQRVAASGRVMCRNAHQTPQIAEGVMNSESRDKDEGVAYLSAVWKSLSCRGTLHSSVSQLAVSSKKRATLYSRLSL